MTPEQDLRFKCLELACRQNFVLPDGSRSVEEDIVDLAARYEVFVLNGHDQVEVHAPVKTAKAQKKTETVKEETKTKNPLVSTISASTAGDGQVSEAVTYDEVKAKVLEVAKIKGRDASLDLLSHFGVVTKDEKGDRRGNIADLKEEQFADVISKAIEMLA
jgi:replication-associated recombination protein RarA